jgi:predicted DNA-binding ribbon-helix-helix protein
MPRDDALRTLNTIGSALNALVDRSDYRFAVFIYDEEPQVLFTTRSLAALLHHHEDDARGLTHREFFAAMPELILEVEDNLMLCQAGSTAEWWIEAPDSRFHSRQQCLLIPFPQDAERGFVFAMSEIGSNGFPAVDAADVGKAAMETWMGYQSTNPTPEPPVMKGPAPARLTPDEVGCDAKEKVLRSIPLADGTRTTIRIEPDFWVALSTIAREQDVELSEIVSLVDRTRGAVSRASALRTYVLNYLFRSVYEPVLA